MFDRRELLIGATAGIAQLGQRVVPRITLPGCRWRVAGAAASG